MPVRWPAVESRLVVGTLVISSLMAWLALGSLKFPYALLGTVLFMGLAYFRLSWALIFMVMYIPFQQALPQIRLATGINIFNGLLLALIMGWALQSYRNRQSLVLPNRLNRPILALVAATLISWFMGMLESADPAYAISQFVEVYQWLGVIALYYITLSTIESEEQIKSVLRVISLVVIVMAIDLIRAHSLLSVAGYSHDLRLGGVFGLGGENDLGAFLAEFLFVIIILMAVSRRLLVKGLYLALLAIIGLALLYTYSRGAYLGALAGLSFYAFLKDKRLILLLAAFVLAAPLWAPGSVMDRLAMTVAGGAMESSAASRLDFWKAGLQMMIQAPIFGVGFHRFPMELTRYISDLGSARTAHNMYISVGAEMGLMGLTAFLWLLGTLFKEGWILFKQGATAFSRQLAGGYLAALVALLVINIFGVRFVRVELTGLFWLFSALVVRLNINHRSWPVNPAQE